jgi:hypothetical protein
VKGVEEYGGIMTYGGRMNGVDSAVGNTDLTGKVSKGGSFTQSFVEVISVRNVLTHPSWPNCPPTASGHHGHWCFCAGSHGGSRQEQCSTHHTDQPPTKAVGRTSCM